MPSYSRAPAPTSRRWRWCYWWPRCCGSSSRAACRLLHLPHCGRADLCARKFRELDHVRDWPGVLLLGSAGKHRRRPWAFTPDPSQPGVSGVPIAAITSDLAANAATGLATASGGSVASVVHYSGASTDLLDVAVRDADHHWRDCANFVPRHFLKQRRLDRPEQVFFVTRRQLGPGTPNRHRDLCCVEFSCPAGADITFVGTLTDTPAPGSHTYRLFVATQAVSGMSAVQGDLSLTEIRR